MANDDSTQSGITTGADGTRHIPSSVRADGSVRKEIKVRPGYRPPEDVERYKNRTAEAFRNRGKGGVLGAERVEDDKSNESASAAANKNAKRREARKRAAASGKAEIGEASTESKEDTIGDEATRLDPEIENQKEAKKLVKKLRQAKELKEKKEAGSALLPEQFEKVIKINELIRQLNALGFDTEGEKKIDGEVSASNEKQRDGNDNNDKDGKP